MATVNANLQGLSLSSDLAAHGPYYRTKKGQTAKYLPLSSVNNKQVGINYAGFAQNYLFEGLEKNIFNSLNRSYRVQKHTSRTEFNQAMSDAGKVGSSLKNIDYKRAGTEQEKIKSEAKEAAEKLQKKVKDVDFGKKQREILTEGLRNLQKYADDPGKSTELNADEVVETTRQALEEKSGLLAESALSADEAAGVALAEADHYLSLGEGTADYLERGVNTLKNMIGRFEQLGRFDIDAKRAGAIFDTFRNEVGHAQAFSKSVAELSDFAKDFKLDDDAKSTTVSVGVLEEFARGLEMFDEDFSQRLDNGINAVQKFIDEGKGASARTIAEAKEAVGFLGEVAETYADVVKLNEGDQDWLWTAVNDMKNLTDRGSEPFKQLKTLENFGKDYNASVQSAKSLNRGVANEVGALLDKYNETITHLHDRRGISTRFDDNLRSYPDAKEFSRSLEEIGVDVDFTGALSVDKDKLTDALTNGADKVERVLGQSGLADRITKSVANSNYQSERMSPTINSWTARAASILSPRWTVAAMMYGNHGNFMDMYL